jgi:hypothetical protein
MIGTVFGQPSSQPTAPASVRSMPPSGHIVLLGYFAEHPEIAAESCNRLTLAHKSQ